MHERGVVKRDTLHKRRKCTEHGHGNRDQSRLLRNVKVRNMCSWYLRYRFSTQMHRTVNETFTLTRTIRSVR